MKGGGLIISSEIKELKVKLAVSKNHAKNSDPDYIWRGWHTLSKNELDLFDIYIFSVRVDSDDPYYFVFSNENLKKLCSQKETDSAGKYHFYFVKGYDNKVYEDRDDKIDMSEHFNNFSFIN